MLADFVVVIGVVSIPETWQKKQLLDIPFATIITKKILGRNVTLTSFVVMIAIVVARR
jgi:hypothetical protein